MTPYYESKKVGEGLTSESDTDSDDDRGRGKNRKSLGGPGFDHIPTRNSYEDDEEKKSDFSLEFASA